MKVDKNAAEEKAERTYYFSVEGQTEKLYLKRLEKIINSDKGSKYKVIFNIIVSRNPLKRINSLPQKEENTVYHFCDYENDDPYYDGQFQKVLDGLIQAKKKKFIKDYKLGYSNQTFDLWIILHRKDSFAPNVDRKKYIAQINKAYGTKFRGMQEYKREENLRKLLAKISLEDVLSAIEREKQIMKRNAHIGHKLYEYKGFSYYRENPSLTVGTIIEEILAECGLKENDFI